MKKRNYRKVSIGKGVKRPKSKNMVGIKPKPRQDKKEILDMRFKQSKNLNYIKDSIKKIRENNISINGLEHLSLNSIKKLQKTRKNNFLHLKNAIQELDFILEKIIQLETKYKQNIQNKV